MGGGLRGVGVRGLGGSGGGGLPIERGVRGEKREALRRRVGRDERALAAERRGDARRSDARAQLEHLKNECL